MYSTLKDLVPVFLNYLEVRDILKLSQLNKDFYWLMKTKYHLQEIKDLNYKNIIGDLKRDLSILRSLTNIWERDCLNHDHCGNHIYESDRNDFISTEFICHECSAIVCGQECFNQLNWVARNNGDRIPLYYCFDCGYADEICDGCEQTYNEFICDRDNFRCENCDIMICKSCYKSALNRAVLVFDRETSLCIECYEDRETSDEQSDD